MPGVKAAQHLPTNDASDRSVEIARWFVAADERDELGFVKRREAALRRAPLVHHRIIRTAAPRKRDDEPR